MPFNSNFDSRFQITDGEVIVTGSSEHVEDAVLVSRSVALQQADVVVHGSANPALKWASPAIETAGLEVGDALALGSETYLFADGSPANAAFATFTWAQTVTLEKD